MKTVIDKPRGEAWDRPFPHSPQGFELGATRSFKRLVCMACREAAGGQEWEQRPRGDKYSDDTGRQDQEAEGDGRSWVWTYLPGKATVS